jgi:peptide deformylase
MNPLLMAETEDKEYGWEYSASFPGIRAMIKRPLGIRVSYLNEEGDEIE